MKMGKAKYGLFTAISMVVGIVIGSGIFFKTDEILTATGGDIFLGIIVFTIGAFSIIFGSLTIAELAIRAKSQDGAIGYYEEFISKKFASGFGWFQLFVYYPTLGVVIAYVGGGYLSSLFGIVPTLESRSLFGFATIVVFFVANVLSEKFGSIFQNLSTVIKLLPIAIVAVVGFCVNFAQPEIPEGVTYIGKSNIGLTWIAALVPVAFSYEGWIIATNITGEVKNPNKTMPLALTIAPIIVLVSYILYFVGLSKMLSVEYVMSMKNAATYKAGKMLFGPYGDKILLIFITIAVIGVVNGVIIGMLRVPHILQSKGMLPIKEREKPFKLTLKTCVLPMLLCAFWMLMQYITQKTGMLRAKDDVTSVSIVLGYAFYICLYVKVIMMKSIKSVVKRFVFPLCGIFGAMIILVGGIMANICYTVMFTLLCAIIFFLGSLYYQKNNRLEKHKYE